MAPEKDPRLRLNQFLARSGAGSRRGAEDLIREGRVTVNGQTVTDLATLVDPEGDSVKVDGQRLRPSERTSCYVLYKPKEVVSTLEDPEGRPCLRGLMPRDARGLFPVGRLDYHSEGLLLLTNDGDLGFRLLHPRFKVAKVYQVKVKGTPTHEALNRLRRGIVLEGRRTLPMDIRRVPSRETQHTWVEITMMEGRKNQLREMFFRIEHPVIKLKRVAMGPVRLGKMRPGEVRPLTREELEELREASSGTGARELGAGPRERDGGTPRTFGPVRPHKPSGKRPPGDRKPGRPAGPHTDAKGRERDGGTPRTFGPARPNKPAGKRPPGDRKPGRPAGTHPDAKGRERDGGTPRTFGPARPHKPAGKRPPGDRKPGRPAGTPAGTGTGERGTGAPRGRGPSRPPGKGPASRRGPGRPSGKPARPKEPRR
jgi:pseudouridine synthase